MGIFRYFRYITTNYPSCFTTIKKTYKNNNAASNSDTKGVECVLFDLNALIHPCFQEVFEYGSDVKVSFLLQQRKSGMTYQELEKMAFNLLTKKIEEHIYYIKPTKAIYIAIDGVAGSSKSNQQRQRRFKNALNPATNKYGFDPNSITCGTDLMDRLCKHIFFFIRRKKESDWKNLKVVYSDMYVAGEGENKLKLWIESEPYRSVTIVSPDGDVIMLALLLNKDEVYIFRQNVFTDIPGDYFFVDIMKLKTSLFFKLGGECVDKVLEQPQKVINDYVLFHFFIGNDFLPHMSSIEIDNKGIEMLYKCYNETFTESGYLIEERLSKININKNAFMTLVNKLASYEIKMLIDKCKKKVSWPDKILMDNILRTTEGNNLNFTQYRKDYYIKKLKFNHSDDNPAILEKQIKAMCEEYILGLNFVLRYYFRSIPTYSWHYPYHYSPLLVDLAKYAKEISFEPVFEVRPALSIYESLFGILPLQCFNLLPEEIVKGLDSKIKLDSDFSTDFTIDLDGKVYEYEGICILPFLSYDKIKRYFKNIKLTPERVDKLARRTKVYNF